MLRCAKLVLIFFFIICVVDDEGSQSHVEIVAHEYSTIDR